MFIWFLEQSALANPDIFIPKLKSKLDYHIYNLHQQTSNFATLLLVN